MEEKAQGALEYLLLIAGAVLVAAIVITLLSGIAGPGKNDAATGNERVQNALNTLAGT